MNASMTTTTNLILLSKRCCMLNTMVRRTASVSSRFDHPASATPANVLKPFTQPTNTMQAWQVHSFGGVEQLSLSDCVRIPMLAGPNDVLVQISTTSVNPIDTAMLGEKYITPFLIIKRYYIIHYDLCCTIIKFVF